MEMTILFTRFGDMEGTKWANAQMATDFDADSESAGCQVGKINIVTDNNFDVSRRLHRALVDAKAPVTIEAEIGSKSSGGKIVTLIKDFKLKPTKAA